MLQGIDVSSYQSTSYSTSGLSFVGIKVTEGLTYVNPNWTGQRATARKAGLVTVFYHYPHIANSPAAEADHFLGQINLQPGDVLCLDWEWYGQNVTNDQARTYKTAWLAYVRAKVPGHRVIVYVDRTNWLTIDTDSNCGDGLWIADYVTAGQPRVQHPWIIHQYSSNPVDQDVANFNTVADLKAWTGGTAPTPPPAVPQWRRLLDHVMSIPEQVYETWTSSAGWNNQTQFGAEYGENGVSWCVIFNWDMYHDVGLDSLVPKTDNVTNFSNWAKARGQWSLYPSVGAWVNFDNGGHTEIVTGFDDQRVYTKGGNSIQAGSQDRGQGNGVWSHSELRRTTRVTGYFAPRFPDNVCPPTADPHDPRGGTAVTSYLPEDLMPLSDADVQKVATASAMAVLGYKNADALKKNPQLPDVYGYIAGTNGAVASLTAQLGALSAVVTALSKEGGLTVEQATAAAAAGAKAALEELAAAIGKAGA